MLFVIYFLFHNKYICINLNKMLQKCLINTSLKIVMIVMKNEQIK